MKLPVFDDLFVVRRIVETIDGTGCGHGGAVREEELWNALERHFDLL